MEYDKADLLIIKLGIKCHIKKYEDAGLSTTLEKALLKRVNDDFKEKSKEV